MNTEQLTNTVYEGNVTTVTVDIGSGVRGVGVARCRPDDVFSKKTGEILATGRALQDIGYKIEGIGHRSVVTNDELERALRLIDETADEMGVNGLSVGSQALADLEAKQAAEEDELVNQFIGMLIGQDLQSSAEAAADGPFNCTDPSCSCKTDR